MNLSYSTLGSSNNVAGDFIFKFTREDINVLYKVD